MSSGLAVGFPTWEACLGPQQRSAASCNTVHHVATQYTMQFSTPSCNSAHPVAARHTASQHDTQNRSTTQPVLVRCTWVAARHGALQHDTPRCSTAQLVATGTRRSTGANSRRGATARPRRSPRSDGGGTAAAPYNRAATQHNVLQHGTTVLQCTATCCNTIDTTVLTDSPQRPTLQRGATRCSTAQYAVTQGSVLHRHTS
jgi:hypothetical protein